MTRKQPTVERATVADCVSSNTAPHKTSHTSVESGERFVCMYRKTRQTAQEQRHESERIPVPGEPLDRPTLEKQARRPSNRTQVAALSPT